MQSQKQVQIHTAERKSELTSTFRFSEFFHFFSFFPSLGNCVIYNFFLQINWKTQKIHNNTSYKSFLSKREINQFSKYFWGRHRSFWRYKQDSSNTSTFTWSIKSYVSSTNNNTCDLPFELTLLKSWWFLLLHAA